MTLKPYIVPGNPVKTMCNLIFVIVISILSPLTSSITVVSSHLESGVSCVNSLEILYSTNMCSCTYHYYTNLITAGSQRHITTGLGIVRFKSAMII